MTGLQLIVAGGKVTKTVFSASAIAGTKPEKPAETATPKLHGKNGKKGAKGDEAEEGPRPPVEFASKNDYQLGQAVNLLKAWQIMKH